MRPRVSGTVQIWVPVRLERVFMVQNMPSSAFTFNAYTGLLLYHPSILPPFKTFQPLVFLAISARHSNSEPTVADVPHRASDAELWSWHHESAGASSQSRPFSDDLS